MKYKYFLLTYPSDNNSHYIIRIDKKICTNKLLEHRREELYDSSEFFVKSKEWVSRRDERLDGFRISKRDVLRIFRSVYPQVFIKEIEIK